MQKYLILLAGCPCTGKTYLINKIREVFNDILLITPDEGKQLYAESVGFNSLHQKAELEKKVWHFYYGVMNLYMDAGKKIIVSEYPFSDKQKDKLFNFANNYNYQIITIRLVADFDILWQRRYIRDRSPERHLSFIMQSYHYGDTLDNRSLANDHITKDEFKKICEDRKYDQFELGQLYEIDVSDFSKVDYSMLIQDLKNKIR